MATTTASRSNTASRSKAKSPSGGSSKSKSSSSGGTKSRAAKKSGGLTSMVSKAADAVVSMFTPSSETNAIELLKADHDKVQEMFDKVKASPNRDHRELFKKIKLELDTHAHIEETIFYPHLLKKGDKEIKKIVREGIQEHAQVKMFLYSLSRMTNGKSENFKAKLQVLIEDVEHHVKEEENDLFPKVKDQIPSDKLEELGGNMEAEKAAFKKRRARSASRKRTTAAAASK